MLLRLIAPEYGADFGRAIQRVPSADFENTGKPLGREFPRVMQRSARAIGESGGAIAQVALGPFVADAALNAVAAAQLGLRLQSFVLFQDEFHTLIHGVNFFPRHGNIVVSQRFP